MELLEQYLALTTDEERNAFLAELSNDDLASLLAEAETAFNDAEVDEPTDDDLIRMGQLADVIDACRAQDVTRAAEAEDRRARAAEIAQRVRGEATDEGGDGEGDGDAGAGDGEGDADGAGEGGDADGEGAEGEGDGEGAGATPELVTASSAPARRPAPSAARPAPARRAIPAQHPRGAMVAATDVPGIPAGQRLVGMDELARAVVARLDSLRSASRGGYNGPAQNLLVASIMGGFPEERMLGRDPIVNERRLAPVLDAMRLGNEQALAASGGLCAPTTVTYDMPTLGSDARPVRDALPRYGVDRGGVRWMERLQLADVAGAVDIWTMTDDENAVDDPNVRKPCLRIECPEELEAIIEAITQCLEFGNIVARTFPELVAAALQLVGVAQARLAENELLTTIGTGSTAVTSGQLLGATRDILDDLDRTVAYYTYRYRLGEDARLQFIAPRWMRNMIRTDLAREMPGATAERLATADALIGEFFAVRGITPIWHMDGSPEVWGPQGPGPIQGYPTTVRTWLFPAGTWVHLDGGQLNLGVVRDAELVASNDYRLFSETFEFAAKMGAAQSLQITMDLCADGTTSGTSDIDPCTTGS